MSQTEQFPDMHFIEQEESDYLMPLTTSEANNLKFALEIAMIRAEIEEDTESMRSFDSLHKRLKHNGLIKSE